MKPMRMAVALIVTGLAVVCGLAQVKGLKPDVIPEVPPLDLPVVDPKAVPENATFFMVTYMAEDNGGFGVPWPWNPLGFEPVRPISVSTFEPSRGVCPETVPPSAM